MFKDDILKQAQNMAGLGVTEEQMAKIWQVSVRTLGYWKKKNPEFLQAIERGKETANLSVSQKLYKRAAQDGEVQAIKYWPNRQMPGTMESDKVMATVNNKRLNKDESTKQHLKKEPRYLLNESTKIHLKEKGL